LAISSRAVRIAAASDQWRIFPQFSAGHSDRECVELRQLIVRHRPDDIHRALNQRYRHDVMPVRS
jgi:hypothetical protein